MSKYKNLMEDLVEEKFEFVCGSYENICLCDTCRNDILSCALNRLPPRYFATNQGHLYSKLDSLKTQFSADVITALTEAVNVVTKHPRH